MNKCSFNENALKQIRSLAQTMVVKYRLSKGSLSSLIQQKNDLLKNQILEQYNCSDSDIDLISINLSEIFERAKIHSDEFTKDSIKNTINGIRSGVQSGDKTTTEELFDTETNTNKREASLEFLNSAYGSAVEVKEANMRITNANLFDCLFINRGTLGGIRSVVENPTQLNENIRNYHQVLLNRIVKYLKKITDGQQLPSDIVEALNNPTLYVNRKNTGVLDVLMDVIEQYLSPIKFTPQYLRDRYNQRLNNPDAKLELDAYNAWIILKHFDDYISLTLGKAIDINDYGKKTGEDKYQIASKTSEMITNWRTNENIDPSKEIDNISQLAITTTPLYKWGQDKPLEGRYLSFQNFSHIIGKIKEMGMSNAAWNTRIGQNSTGRDMEYETPGWSELSDDAKAFFTEYDAQGRNIGKRLSTAINQIRKNPQQYLPYIFELLSNKEFVKNHTELFNNTTWFSEEKDYLWSIARGIFSGNSNESLKNIVGKAPKIDYMVFLSQTADSIFKNTFIQYFIDENGQVKTRQLIDLSLNRIERQMRMTINTNNGVRFKQSYKEGRMKDYNINPISDREIDFTIPGTDIKVNVHTSGLVRMQSLNLEDESTTIAITQFLDGVLKLNFANDAQLLETFLTQSKDSTQAMTDLVKFASRIMLNQYISNVVLDGKTKTNIEKSVKKLYGDPPKYNYQLGQINLISNLDRNIIKDLAKAKATNKGLLTASQVKDSEQAGQSLTSLSRLLGSVMSQWDLIERKPNSATNHFILLQDNDVFEGHSTTSEYYDGKDSKKATKFSVAEMNYAQIVSNFIPALLEGNEITNRDFIKSGHASFLASVNSDKGTIGQIKINLNKVIPKYGKAIKDLSSAELDDFISEQLGTYFTKVLTAVQEDLNNISGEIRKLDEGFNINLSEDYLTGFRKFNEYFNQNRNKFIEKAETAEELIKYCTTKYNYAHRLKPIELIENVHYKADKKGNLHNSNTLIANIMRFQPLFIANQLERFARSQGKHPREVQDTFNELSSKYVTLEKFWGLQAQAIVKSTLKSKFELNVFPSTLQNDFIKKHYSDWVSPSSKMIIAKVHYKGNSYSISSQRDIIRIAEELRISESDVLGIGTLELNPIIEQYNKLDYLFTSEWLFSTVGSFLGHPSKAKPHETDTPEQIALKEEASQYLAQHKRNVSMTAQMHEFSLNTLNGIPEDYNIAVIEDIHVDVPLITKETNETTPYDGGTFVNPFIVYLENNSLGGARAGITKKPFVHFKHGRVGIGGIIKTAGFGMTNDWMRNSPRLQHFMQMMTNHDWVDEDGNSYYSYRPNGQFRALDILHDWRGNIINYDDVVVRIDGKFYKVELVPTQWNGNVYRRLTEVDPNSGEEIGQSFIEKEIKNGVEQDKIHTINSNYTLWQLFGGVNCYEFTEKGKLIPSERSITNVVMAMNSIGTLRHKDANTTYSIDEVETQEQLWQPLKQVDINYLVTAGAIKQGQANVNKKSKYDTFASILDFQRIKMYQAGIQLDKEHSADHAELSLPTQIVSACASRGYTDDQATRLYEALAQAAELGVKTQLDAMREYIKYPGQRTIELLTEEAFKIVIDNLANSSTSTSFAQIVAESVKKAVKDNPDLKYSSSAFPLSDSTIFGKTLSSISSYLTRQAIRIKIPGILSVLTPSHGVFKLYDGKKFETFTNPNKQLEQLQLKYDNTPIVGEVHHVFQIQNLNNDLIEWEQVNKPRRNATGSNKTVRLYLKGQKERGYFELVQDTGFNQYSVHFKPQNPDGSISSNPNSFSQEEKTILFQQVANLIPEGASLSLYEEFSERDLAEINRFRSLGFKQVDTIQLSTSFTSETLDTYNYFDIEFKKGDKVTTFNKELAEFIDQSLLLPLLGRVNKFSKYTDLVNAINKSENKEKLEPILQQQLQKFKETSLPKSLLGLLSFKIPSVYLNSSNASIYNFFNTWGISVSDSWIEESKNKVREYANIPEIKIPILKKVVTPETMKQRLIGVANLELGRKYKITYDRPQTIFDKEGMMFRGLQVVNDYTIVNEKDGKPAGMQMHHATKSIHVNEPVLMEIYQKKEWMATENGHTKRNQSEPIDRDFTYDEFFNFCLMHEYMHTIHKRRGDESSFDYETRINNEALKEIDRINNNEGYMEYIELDSPAKLRELRQKVASGEVVKVVEYIKEGRDLGAYNARFNTTTGERYQLWELDSLHEIYEFDRFKKVVKDYLPDRQEEVFQAWYKNKYGPMTYKQYDVYLRSWQQRDSENLSPSVENKLDQFNRLVARNPEPQVILNWLKIVLSEPDFEEVSTQGDIINAARQKLLELSKVQINGVAYDVDKSSVETQAFEIIMPKTFKHEFGLDTYADLEAIKNNPDFFIDQYFDKRALSAEKEQYDVALVRNDGSHYYLLSREHLLGSGLRKVPSSTIRTINENGKIYRVDKDDNIMYEILPGTEIYSNGIADILVVDNYTNEEGETTPAVKTIDKYVANLHFSTIQFSDNLGADTYTLDLASELSINPRVGRYVQFKIVPEDRITEQTVKDNITKVNSKRVTKDNWRKELDENDEIIQQGRRKHTAFLKSLEIVAARIPSQSMQSYMAMQTVAYDNPNINTAHVSIFQLLLQGSDLDIDAVSLVTYDIDSNGMFRTWSPYSNTTSLELLNESLKLPIPTGEKVVFKTSDKLSDSGKIFTQFKDLFALLPIQSKLGVVDRIKFHPLVLNTVEQLQSLKRFLEIKDFYKPTEEQEQRFIDALVDSKVLLLRPSNAHEAVQQIFEGLEKYINNHNEYLSKFDNRNLSIITNNISTYSLYQSVIDPVNQTQAQESVDGDTTNEVKNIANSNPEVAEDAAYRVPGNYENKFEAIKENQEGKDCLAISAVGIKGFFTLTKYFNNILNNGTSQDQSLLNTKQLIANIRAKDPSTITNEELAQAIVSAKNQKDQAIVLSALLGLAADNAKELALPKLNASQKMIGMYLFGISIGIDFKELSQILMSPTALVIKETMDDNVFNDYDGYGQISEKVFNFFEKSPYKLFGKYNTDHNPFKFLEDWCGKQNNYSKFGTSNILLWIKKQKKNNVSLAELFKKLDATVIQYQQRSSNTTFYNQFLDVVKDYAIQQYTINEDTFKKIKMLAKGAITMKTIGQIAGLNQGLKGDIQSILNKAGLIQDLFDDTKIDISELNRSDSKKVDLERFAFDQNYRSKIIEVYKGTDNFINIPHMIQSVPHLLKYVQVLALDYALSKRSYRFRSIANLQESLTKLMNGNVKDIRTGINNYVTDKLVSSFLLQQQETITLPTDSTIFDKKGNVSEPIKAPKEIQLGTDWGNASFRQWFEYTVIPALQKGYLGDKYDARLVENKFIQGLSVDLKTNTVSGNGTIVYTLPINMLPKTDSERAVFNSYLDAFNKLEEIGLEYTMADGRTISLQKLFVLYCMIAHNWKQGESSLVPILENAIKNDKFIKTFHEYEDSLDKSNFDISKFPNYYQEIIPYLAPKESPYKALSKYIWALNPITQQREMLYKVGRRQIRNEDEDGIDYTINGYTYKPSEVNRDSLNYFTRNDSSEPLVLLTQKIKIGNEFYNMAVKYNYDSQLSQVEVEKSGVSITTLDDTPGIVKIKNGKLAIDTPLVKNMIERKLNDPCKNG